MSAAPVQQVVCVRSEQEAALRLAEGGPDTRLIAGGTDLMLQMERGRAAPASLVDLRRAGLDAMELRDDALVIGATATARALSRWGPLRAHACGLFEAAATLSVPQIRNFATLGGNLANASPAADMVPPLVAMDSVLGVRRSDEVSELPAHALATGPGRTVLAPDALITWVRVPRWGEGSFHWFSKFGYRDAQIIAVASLAFSCAFDGEVLSRVGIALGSVGPRCLRASRVERFLLGQRLSREVGEAAVALLAEDIAPIDDVRASAAFRMQIAQNYLADALVRAHHHQSGRPLGDTTRRFLLDPAPRPPEKSGERSTPLADLGVPPARALRILAPSAAPMAASEGAAPPSAKRP